MVEIRDLQEDYEEVKKTGELDKAIEESPRMNILMYILLAIALFSMTFWSIAWLY